MAKREFTDEDTEKIRKMALDVRSGKKVSDATRLKVADLWGQDAADFIFATTDARQKAVSDVENNPLPVPVQAVIERTAQAPLMGLPNKAAAGLSGLAAGARGLYDVATTDKKLSDVPGDVARGYSKQRDILDAYTDELALRSPKVQAATDVLAGAAPIFVSGGAAAVPKVGGQGVRAAEKLLLGRGDTAAETAALNLGQGAAGGLGYTRERDVGGVAGDIAAGTAFGGAVGMAPKAAVEIADIPMVRKIAGGARGLANSAAEKMSYAFLGASEEAQQYVKKGADNARRIVENIRDIPAKQVDIDERIAVVLDEAKQNLSNRQALLDGMITEARAKAEKAVDRAERVASDKLLASLDKFQAGISEQSGKAFKALEGGSVSAGKLAEEASAGMAEGMKRMARGDSDIGALKEIKRLVERYGLPPEDVRVGGINPIVPNGDLMAKSIEGLPAEREAIKAGADVLNSDPVRALGKYARGGELPEVTGEGKNAFARRGDDMADELGFEDSEAARRAYEQNVAGRERLKGEKAAVKEKGKTAKELERLAREMQGKGVSDKPEFDPFRDVSLPEIKSIVQRLDTMANEADKFGVDARTKEMIQTVRKRIDDNILKADKVNPGAAKYRAIMEALDKDTRMAVELSGQLRSENSRAAGLRRLAAGEGNYNDEALRRIGQEVAPDVMAEARSVAGRREALEGASGDFARIKGVFGAKNPDIQGRVSGLLGNEVVREAGETADDLRRVAAMSRYGKMIQRPAGGMNPVRVERAAELLGNDIARDAEALQYARQFASGDVRGSRRTGPIVATGSALGAAAGTYFGGGPGIPSILGSAIGSLVALPPAFLLDRYGGRLSLLGARGQMAIEKQLGKAGAVGAEIMRRASSPAHAAALHMALYDTSPEYKRMVDEE